MGLIFFTHVPNNTFTLIFTFNKSRTTPKLQTHLHTIYHLIHPVCMEPTHLCVCWVRKWVVCVKFTRLCERVCKWVCDLSVVPHI